MKKIAELKDPIDYFIYKWCIILCDIAKLATKTKTVKSIFFQWGKLASNSTYDLHCSHLHRLFSLDISDKTTFQITSSCLTVCLIKVDVIFHLTTISSKR